MENKKEEKSQLNFKLHNNVSIILSITIFIYFLYGFYVNENSAGAGGYYGDFKIIWSNLILLKKDLIRIKTLVSHHKISGKNSIRKETLVGPRTAIL